ERIHDAEDLDVTITNRIINCKIWHIYLRNNIIYYCFYLKLACMMMNVLSSFCNRLNKWHRLFIFIWKMDELTMSEIMYHGIAIALYLLVMLLIGWYGYKKTTDLDDYMLGGRNLGALVTALSAGAADMSGWLIMGLPGEIYEVGLSALWIAIGLTIGAYLNWVFVAPRLRVYTQVSNNSITIPSFFDNRLRDDSGILRIISGIVILVF